ncbi:MAG: hypothetical protein AAGF91_05780 [Actinomycetota bacterium]
MTATTLVVAGLGAPGGAQTDDVLDVVSIADSQRTVALSDDGSLLVTETTTAANDDGSVVAGTTVTLVDLVAVPAVTTDLAAAVGDANGFAPSISADGCVVVYSTLSEIVAESDDTTDTLVESGDPADDLVDDAAVPTSEPPAESLPPHDSGSGDSVPVSDDPAVLAQVEPAATVTLRAVDRCAGGAPTIVELPVLDADRSDPYPPAALSADGTTIVVSTGADVVVLTDQGSAADPPGPAAYAETARFDAAVDTTDSSITGDIVDVSADGSTVVFETASADDPDRPGDIRVWTAVDGPVLLAESASAPSISGDGSLVAFAAGADSPVAAPGISVVQRGVDPLVVRNVAPDGSSPTLSTGGAHVAFLAAEGVAVADWSAGDEPFAPDTFTLSTLPGALDTSPPAIDRTGATVAVVAVEASDDPGTTAPVEPSSRPDPGLWGPLAGRVVRSGDVRPRIGIVPGCSVGHRGVDQRRPVQRARRPVDGCGVGALRDRSRGVPASSSTRRVVPDLRRLRRR